MLSNLLTRESRQSVLKGKLYRGYLVIGSAAVRIPVRRKSKVIKRRGAFIIIFFSKRHLSVLI